jgi:hypothetical protein
MIAYRYTLGNTSIETLNLNDIPNGIIYETFEIQEQVEVIEVPQEVQLWRIRTVLKLMGLENTIENALNGLEEPTKTAGLYIWNFGTTVERNSQTVLMLQSVLQMTDDQVNEMFIQANNIQL